MRKAVIILVASLIISSCSFPSSIMQGVSGNPFKPSYQLSEPLSSENIFNPPVSPEVPPEEVVPPAQSAEPLAEGSDEFTFVMIADPHINRTDTGVAQHTEEFISFLEQQAAAGTVYPFIVCLGDLVDNGDIYDSQAQDFIETARGYTELKNFIYVLGNHDIRTHSKSEWESEYNVLTPGHDVSRMIRYSYKGVSIYKLDNSSRIFGKDQLAMLEEALRNDPNEYRIFLAHEVVATGGALDQSTVLFGSEAGELLRLFSIMEKHGVSMLFTGHHHKGNVIYEGSHFAEFNAAALHSRSVSFESDGYWYTVTVSPSAGLVTVAAYCIEDGYATPWMKAAEYNFRLYAADEVGEEEPGSGGNDEETGGDTDDGGQTEPDDGAGDSPEGQQ